MSAAHADKIKKAVAIDTPVDRNLKTYSNATVTSQ